MAHTDPQPWSGRHDEPGSEHARWHTVVRPLLAAGRGEALHKETQPGEAVADDVPPGTALLGFASDEGVRRNQGRPGAAEGPQALREALAGLALRQDALKYDAGDISVSDQDLESGQADFGARLADLLEAGHFTVGLGGGHEVAYASYSGVASYLSEHHGDHPFTLGVLNLDAHFDLREAEQSTSGTGFLQIHRSELAAGRQLRYGAVGISPASNTRALFLQAKKMGADFLLDTECGQRVEVTEFVRDFASSVDYLYLTIDLDVLPAAVAPGVSAPAAFGVELPVVRAAAVAAARTKKLVHMDVAELNPSLDIDQRTARTAARLIHDVVAAREAVPPHAH